MALDRRRMLRVLAGTGAAATASAALPAEAARARKQPPPEALGMLYDTTLCIGCKACVVACREANDLEPTLDAEKLHQAPLDLDARTKNVIKLYQDPDSPERSYFKAQCMHCVDPACASACMLGSLHKDEETGVVSYNPTYCVGCRYCQMACPFNVAKFEFEKAVPKIVKCELCRHRYPADMQMTQQGGFSHFAKGQGPACCEVCPRGAVIYGKRTELLAEAKRRVAEHPDRYQQKIYGESDLGGTQVLYLSHVPFDKIGLPQAGERGVPHVASTIQEGLYQGFVAPVALYAVLGAVLWRNRSKGGEVAAETHEKGGEE
jgi:Fe-S-cluster-containing dehydrogenase component